MNPSGDVVDFERRALEYLRTRAPQGSWKVVMEGPEELRVTEAGTSSPWFVSLAGSTVHVGKCRDMPPSQSRTWEDAVKRLDDIVSQWKKAKEPDDA